MAINSACGLSEKMETFCREYVTDFNGTRAALAAGYMPKNAKVRASKMLAEDRVQSFIAQLSKPRLDRLEITADRVMDELARIGFGEPSKMEGLKYSDKVKALAELADLKALYPDKTVNLKGNLTARVTGLAQIMDELDGADTGTGPGSAPEA